MDLGRLLGPGDHAAGHGHHLGHLEARRGDGQAVDGEAAGVAGRVVGGQDQPAVQPRRHAADEVDPGRVALGGQVVVAPVPGSAARTRVAVWSRD